MIFCFQSGRLSNEYVFPNSSLQIGNPIILSSFGIKLHAQLVVPGILNRQKEDLCPMERAVKGLDDPAAMVIEIKKTLERIKNK